MKSDGKIHLFDCEFSLAKQSLTHLRSYVQAGIKILATDVCSVLECTKPLHLLILFKKELETHRS